MRVRLDWWLVAIVGIGLLVRTILLADFPTGFTPDEAAFGYNAYSLLKTGADEWGTPGLQLLVSNMRSFGDYKLPLYAFLTIPSILFMGLNEFATRLPNALIGTAAIVAVYFAAKALAIAQARIAALLMAVSPWAVGMSRGAFEANLATFFFPAGIALYLSRFWAVGAIFFSLGFYSYHSARLILIPLFILLALFYRTKHTLKFGALLLLLCLPGLFSFTNKSSARLKDVGIFSPTDNWQSVSDRRFTARITGLPDPVARIFSNKVVALGSDLTKSYLSLLSPQFLFTEGAREATYGLIPGRGLLFYAHMGLIIFFLVMLCRKPTQTTIFLTLCFLLSLVPAALSKGPGFPANRAVVALPFIILMAVSSLPKISHLLKFVVVAAILVQSTFFIEDYFFHSQFILSRSMNYGWAETLKRAIPIAQEYESVNVSRSLSEPHIFIAFYSSYPPQEYQIAAQDWLVFEEKGLRFLDQYDGYYLGKFRFGDLNYGLAPKQPTLYIGKPEEFPIEQAGFFQINYPDGTPAFRVAEKSR